MQPDGIIQSTTGHRYPDESTIAASDFIFRTGDDDRPELWSTATAPSIPTLVNDGGALGQDRVTIIWADDTIVDEWLQVTVLAANTNLAAAEVFYFGNLVGELVNTAGEAKVDLADLTALLANYSTPAGSAGIENPGDLDRDGDVDSTDSALIASTHWNHTISLLSPPAVEAYQLLGSFTADARVNGPEHLRGWWSRRTGSIIRCDSRLEPSARWEETPMAPPGPHSSLTG